MKPVSGPQAWLGKSWEQARKSGRKLKYGSVEEFNGTFWCEG